MVRVLEDLRALRGADGQRAVRVVVFSGNIRSRVAFLEQRYGFRRLFDLECWSYDAGVSKPDPRFLHYVRRPPSLAPSSPTPRSYWSAPGRVPRRSFT